MPEQRSKEKKHECPSEPIFDDYLETGDVLYIPRGWWHEAIPLAGEESLHIAVGIHPMLIRDYLVWSCFKTLPSDVELRQSIKAECGVPESLARAVRAASEMLQGEAELAEYKQEIFASERVVSRFAVETLGRPNATVGQFRLNSAYRNTSLSSARVHVNGQAISMDATSQRHIGALFSQSALSLNDISKSMSDSKTSMLLQHLAANDVISPL
nr:cupin domain-containing protein [uncultured Variovorax sp.]